MLPSTTTQAHPVSPALAGYYFEIPSIGAIRINTQVRLGWASPPRSPFSLLGWDVGKMGCCVM